MWWWKLIYFGLKVYFAVSILTLVVGVIILCENAKNIFRNYKRNCVRKNHKLTY